MELKVVSKLKQVSVFQFLFNVSILYTFFLIFCSEEDEEEEEDASGANNFKAPNMMSLRNISCRMERRVLAVRKNTTITFDCAY